MTPPLLWVVAGSNGAGKSTYIRRKLLPRLALPFVNADDYARERWADDAAAHVHQAALWARERRAALISERRSFIAETVFSHPSKLDLLRDATNAGYAVWLTWVSLESAELATARVADRVELGGHPVPPDRIVAHYGRIPGLLRQAISLASRAYVVDNTEPERPLRDAVRYERGKRVWLASDVPGWVERAGLSGST